MAWSSKAKALRFGEQQGALTFRDGRWWHIDMTGARVGPISRREAYLTAISYMNAQEVSGFRIPPEDYRAMMTEPTVTASDVRERASD
jgi:hypothetical protein